MLTSIVANPGTTVIDMESYTVSVRQHALLYASTGKRYGFVFGTIDDPTKRPLEFQPWRVSITDILSGVECFSNDARNI